MPLGTTIQTVTEFRDTVAERLGYASYSVLDTLTAAQLDKSLGFAMDAIALEGGWKWLERNAEFTTRAGYSTGTISTTNLNATVTGSGTSWDTSSNVLADDKFNAGEDGFYRVASVTSDTALELATEFAGTALSGATYAIGRDEYDLADGVLELTSIYLVDPARKLIILSPYEWEEITHGEWVTGEPQYAMLIGSDASEAGNSGTNQRIQLWPIPDATYALKYSFRSLATLSGTGSDNAEFGPQMSSLLVYRAMYEMYLQRQEPEAAAEYKEAFGQQLLLTKRSEQSRTRRARHFMKRQFGRYGSGLWPNSWPDVTSK